MIGFMIQLSPTFDSTSSLVDTTDEGPALEGDVIQFTLYVIHEIYLSTLEFDSMQHEVIEMLSVLSLVTHWELQSSKTCNNLLC